MGLPIRRKLAVNILAVIDVERIDEAALAGYGADDAIVADADAQCAGLSRRDP
ncbi:MAG: hypothetical protein ACRDNZ_04840 [Streptosporangiaceae bacterium]